MAIYLQRNAAVHAIPLVAPLRIDAGKDRLGRQQWWSGQPGDYLVQIAGQVSIMAKGDFERAYMPPEEVDLPAPPSYLYPPLAGQMPMPPAPYVYPIPTPARPDARIDGTTPLRSEYL